MLQVRAAILVCIALLLILLAPTQSFGDVLPQNLAVIANKNSDQSLAVAKHYAKRRSIPEKNIISLAINLGETISRAEYYQQIVIPLRTALHQRAITGKIRAILTTFDVPLRISEQDLSETERAKLATAYQRKDSAKTALIDIVKSASILVSSSVEKELPLEISEQELVKVVNSELAAAGKRVNKMPAGQARSAAQKQLGQLIKESGGIAFLANTISPNDSNENNSITQLVNELRDRLTRGSKMLTTLRRVNNDKNRTRLYDLSKEVGGQIAVLKQAITEIASFEKRDSSASVDSELSLLWLDSDQYPINHRLPNPFHYSFEKNKSRAITPAPIIMTARLDGPSVEHAKNLVDLAIVAEQQGLEGRAHFDARGLNFQLRDPYSIYDQDIRDLAWLIRRETSYKASLDNHEQLIDKAKDTIIYVGWYSLRKFTGEFNFNPGAVGYHIASSEALSIRNPEETGWCKNLLERGITATIGPVDEPYLDSFPYPQEFFGLFLTGRYTLVEAYYLTSRYISWRQVLFGDPLYNPWRKDPQLKASDIKMKSLVGAKLKTLPTPPGEKLFPEPIAVRKKLQKEKMLIQKQIDQYFAKPQAK